MTPFALPTEAPDVPKPVVLGVEDAPDEVLRRALYEYDPNVPDDVFDTLERDWLVIAAAERHIYEVELTDEEAEEWERGIAADAADWLYQERQARELERRVR